MPQNKQLLVEEFHLTFDLPTRGCPTWLPPKEADLRIALIEEEFRELQIALRTKDLVGIADGLCDLLYVVYGTAVQCGMDLEPLFAEVHRSNMSKVGGYKDGRGKWIKPSTYSSPKLAILLKDQIDKDRSE
jgi:predicted HAD superfamily Cof-like phosphohydrolase